MKTRYFKILLGMQPLVFERQFFLELAKRWDDLGIKSVSRFYCGPNCTYVGIQAAAEYNEAKGEVDMSYTVDVADIIERYYPGYYTKEMKRRPTPEKSYYGEWSIWSDVESLRAKYAVVLTDCEKAVVPAIKQCLNGIRELIKRQASYLVFDVAFADAKVDVLDRIKQYPDDHNELFGEAKTLLHRLMIAHQHALGYEELRQFATTISRYLKRLDMAYPQEQ